MNKIEKYLGIANHDIQVANNSDELKSYVASILCEIDELQQENQQLKNDINKLQKELNEENLQCSKYSIEFNDLKEKNKQIKDKLSKIETLIINHNCDTGDIYYKYDSRFLKSELKQRILEIVYEQGSDSYD